MKHYRITLNKHLKLSQLKLSRLMLLLLVMTCLMSLFTQPLRKVLLTPSLENASCSTKGKKEWTHLERLEREHKSLIRLYHLREE
jgi:hypothetical protein